VIAVRRLLFFVGLDFFTTILAGHGLDVGSSSSRDSDGEDKIAGLTLPWILAASSVALVAAGVLLWLNPDARRRARRVAPIGVIALVITAPLVAWTASAGEKEKPQNLRVQRETALTGAPELLVSLGEDDMNTLKTTGGKRSIRIVCVDRDRQVVMNRKKKWPFVNERGYDYPHVHLVATRAEVQRAQRCRLRGTRIFLEAKVEGRLPR
jgi:hypothetical protein